MAKQKQRSSFNVMVDLKLSVGIDIKAESLHDAITQAEAWSVSDIVDFSAQGWDHNDSEKPVVTGVFNS
jgi:hypothetical protein